MGLEADTKHRQSRRDLAVVFEIGLSPWAGCPPVGIGGPTVGRQIEEGEELWIELPEKQAKILEQELTEEISADECEALSMYLDKHRKRHPFWGEVITSSNITFYLHLTDARNVSLAP